MARNYGAIRGLSRFEGFTDAVFASFLIPQPSPRYRPGQEPDREEKEQA